MIIWLASGNKHKQQELAAILTGHCVRIPAEAGISNFDPEETGASFAENALIKAKSLHSLLCSGSCAPGLAANAGSCAPSGLAANARDLSESPVLADDSGLCVDFLGGRPGIYSARYYGKDSWNNDGSFRVKAGTEKLKEQEQNLLLLEEVASLQKMEFAKQTSGQSPKKIACRFVCAMVLLFSPEKFYLVQETLEGEIVSSAAGIRGSGGFGYDPIVYLPELGKTVAELSEEEKNRLSHRGKAGRAIAQLLH